MIALGKNGQNTIAELTPAEVQLLQTAVDPEVTRVAKRLLTLKQALDGVLTGPPDPR